MRPQLRYYVSRYAAYYKALRKAAGVNPNTPVALLDRKLGIPSIDSFIKFLCRDYYIPVRVFTKFRP